MPSNTIIRNSIALWAEIEGISGQVDISAVTINYRVNDIPTASNIRVMVGKNVTESNSTSVSALQLAQHKLITIRFATLKQADGTLAKTSPRDGTFPPAAYVDAFPPRASEGIIIFKGKISSVTFQRSTSITGNSASYTLNAYGFLKDLAGTPTTTKTFAQVSPSDGIRFAQFITKNFTAPTGTGASVSAATFASAYLDKYPLIVQDVWKQGISNMLYSVANDLNNDPGARILDSATLSDIGTSNGNTTDNLIKNPAWMANNGNDTINFDAFGVSTSNGGKFAYSLINGLERGVYNGLLNQNAFTAIIQLCQEFHLALIPTIEAYAVVPFTLGLGGEAFKKIYADEINVIQESSLVTTPLRRVILRAVPDYNTDLASISSGRVAQLRGTYPPIGQSPFDNTDISAETYFIDTPNWLSLSAALTPFRLDRLPVDETQQATKTPLTFDYGNLGDMYAKSHYFLSIFGSNGLTITSRLRFDIGPGSLLEVESPGTLADPTEESDNSLFGVVEAVALSFEIDGSSGYASTTFSLGATRSKIDHNNEINTSKVHPLYNNAWKGTPLMQKAGN